MGRARSAIGDGQDGLIRSLASLPQTSNIKRKQS